MKNDEKRVVEGFVAVIPPKITHNALVPYVRKNGTPGIRKSSQLKEEESKLKAYLSPLVPLDRPLEGILSAKVCFLYPTLGKHRQEAPMTEKPDLDNLEKTFWDVCEKIGVIADDRMIVTKCVSKAWADPAGIYVRIEEI